MIWFIILKQVQVKLLNHPKEVPYLGVGNTHTTSLPLIRAIYIFTNDAAVHFPVTNTDPSASLTLWRLPLTEVLFKGN